MMKNTLRILGITLVTGFVLAGSYVEVQDGVGSVGIEMPDASSLGDPATETLARIYLLNETSLVEIGDETPYKIVELEYTENEISIGPVPSGPGYQVILALGSAHATTGVFVPARYAVSESFAVIAGQATLVDLTPVESKFDYADSLLGNNLVDIAYMNSSLYTVSAGGDGSTVYELSLALAITNGAGVALPTSETARSIGIGALVGVGTAVPWINTDKGIIPYNGGALELDFDIDYPIGAEKPDVLASGAFVVGGDLYGWFQVDGGLGGVYDELASLLEKQWLSDIDLSAFITGEPISDLAVDYSSGEVEGYFASALGAFRLPQRVLTDETINTVPEILKAASFFEVVIDEEVAPITELALDYALIEPKLYLGTSKGVVSVLTADIDQDPDDPATETINASGLVTESLGRRVQDMAIGGTYHAVLTDHFLIVSGNGGRSYSVVPIYAGIVTAPSGLFLNDSTGVVYIAGETGIAWVDIDDL